MISALNNSIYRRLLSAQIIALLGTGLLTVALGLLAFDFAGEKAGTVLGTAYAIKMLAYVGLAPIASALSDKIPRKALLIGADLIRAGVALLLPFIDAIWQIYVLIFLLQAASATFTPAFQATIPDILPDEKEYTQALSLSRLAYDLENLVSPAMAGILLTFMSFHWLFAGTVIGFLLSALIVATTQIPQFRRNVNARPFVERLTRGSRIYLATPRLRGLLALNFSAAAVSAFILVNTVVVVRSGYGANETHLAYALAAFGGGSMLAALVLPKLLEQISDRTIMIAAAMALSATGMVYGIVVLRFGLLNWAAFLMVWMIIGVLYSTILTPSGRLLRRSAHAEDRPAIFAAQFALSHACWLITYPIAGWAGEVFGLPVTMIILACLALAGAIGGALLWPSAATNELLHEHNDLRPDHPHFQEFHNHDQGNGHEEDRGVKLRHRHVFVIDDEHRDWPTQG